MGKILSLLFFYKGGFCIKRWYAIKQRNQAKQLQVSILNAINLHTDI